MVGVIGYVWDEGKGLDLGYKKRKREIGRKRYFILKANLVFRLGWKRGNRRVRMSLYIMLVKTNDVCSGKKEGK
jgi:hypothetical protein